VQRETPIREHLFISYATEDLELAEWLTLRLAVEGYKVWCDKIKLLGGESYPRDIQQAIRTSTFRQLALMSKFSVSKDNPLKERIMAMNVGKDLKVKGFIIPINVDGIEPVNLDLTTTDLTYIPFDKGWAQGLNQLLKKLVQIEAPRKFKEGMNAVARWVDTEKSLANRTETVWSNVIPINVIPPTIINYFVPDKSILDVLETEWAFYKQNDHNVWAFGPPKTERPGTLREQRKVNWRATKSVDDTGTYNMVSSLLRQIVRVHCLRKGMQITADGEDVYFPKDLLKNDWLPYIRYDGEKTRVKTVGEITFRASSGEKEKSRYFLAPFFTPLLNRFGGDPCYQLNISLRWTDLNGVEYPRGRSQRRRKHLTKNWWNYQWLARVSACSQWLSEGKEIGIITDGSSSVEVWGKTLKLQSPLGIDEAAVGSEDDEKEEEEIELPEYDADEDEEGADEVEAGEALATSRVKNGSKLEGK
jgi:hypothetical protein